MILVALQIRVYIARLPWSSEKLLAKTPKLNFSLLSIHQALRVRFYIIGCELEQLFASFHVILGLIRR
jgi:hypothetical protein